MNKSAVRFFSWLLLITFPLSLQAQFPPPPPSKPTTLPFVAVTVPNLSIIKVLNEYKKRAATDMVKPMSVARLAFEGQRHQEALDAFNAEMNTVDMQGKMLSYANKMINLQIEMEKAWDELFLPANPANLPWEGSQVYELCAINIEDELETYLDGPQFRTSLIDVSPVCDDYILTRQSLVQYVRSTLKAYKGNDSKWSTRRGALGDIARQLSCLSVLDFKHFEQGLVGSIQSGCLDKLNERGMGVLASNMKATLAQVVLLVADIGKGMGEKSESVKWLQTNGTDLKQNFGKNGIGGGEVYLYDPAEGTLDAFRGCQPTDSACLGTASNRTGIDYAALIETYKSGGLGMGFGNCPDAGNAVEGAVTFSDGVKRFRCEPPCQPPTGTFYSTATATSTSASTSTSTPRTAAAGVMEAWKTQWPSATTQDATTVSQNCQNNPPAQHGATWAGACPSTEKLMTGTSQIPADLRCKAASIQSPLQHFNQSLWGTQMGLRCREAGQIPALFGVDDAVLVWVGLALLVDGVLGGAAYAAFTSDDDDNSPPKTGDPPPAPPPIGAVACNADCVAARDKAAKDAATRAAAADDWVQTANTAVNDAQTALDRLQADQDAIKRDGGTLTQSDKDALQAAKDELGRAQKQADAAKAHQDKVAAAQKNANQKNSTTKGCVDLTCNSCSPGSQTLKKMIACDAKRAGDNTRQLIDWTDTKPKPPDRGGEPIGAPWDYDGKGETGLNGCRNQQQQKGLKDTCSLISCPDPAKPCCTDAMSNAARGAPPEPCPPTMRCEEGTPDPANDCQCPNGLLPTGDFIPPDRIPTGGLEGST